MAKNARQRRAAKRTLALQLLARERNPSTQPVQGHVRAGPSSVNSLKGLTHTGVRVSFQGRSSKPSKASGGRFKLDGFKPKLPDVYVVAPSDDAPEPVARSKPELSPASREHLATLASVKVTKVDRD